MPLCQDELEQDVDAFLAPRTKLTCKGWLDQRPDLVAVLKRKLTTGASITKLHLYLTERHAFPFKRTVFKEAVAGWGIQKEMAA